MRSQIAAARTVCLLLIGVFSLWLTGCQRGDRPPLGKVTGTVSIDRKPAAGLAVRFSTPGFRSSIGLTDQEGRYELNYVKEVMGAAVGTHTVRIQQVSQEGKSVPVRIPARYNRESELTAEVKRGRNTIDFDLTSD